MSSTKNHLPQKIAILASGNGSNAEILIRQAKKLGHEVVGVFCDQEDAFVLERAMKLNVPAILIAPLPSENKLTYGKRLSAELEKYQIQWVFLAGFMRILPQVFLDSFWDEKLQAPRVVNIHPSLLPSFPGRDGYGDAFRADVKVSGVTIHFVDSGVDTGKIIAQKTFPRFKEDTLEEFKRRGLNLEHALYPEVMEKLLGGSCV